LSRLCRKCCRDRVHLEDDEIECNGLNPVFTDIDNNKFFSSYVSANLSVTVGDCARLLLASRGKDGDEEFGYAQVLAIYEDAEQELFIEVRWFLDDLDDFSDSKKESLQLRPGELVESDQLDDVSAGAVCEIIYLTDTVPSNKDKKSSKKSSEVVDTSKLLCRYMVTTGSNSVLNVPAHTVVQRGAALSHYNFAYSEYFRHLGGSSVNAADHYSVAIRNLHISVIPENMPCREVERSAIEKFLRMGIESRKDMKPIYISGMPGTGKTATVK